MLKIVENTNKSMINFDLKQFFDFVLITSLKKKVI
jgi:hypothetical protein